MSALVVVHPGRAAAYGAEELKRTAHRYMFTALSISILIHFSIVGFYYLHAMAGTGGPPPSGYPPKGPIVIIDQGARIPGIWTPPPPTDPAIPKHRGQEGAPLPVPYSPKVDTQTIASQGDLRDKVDPHGIVLDGDEFKMPKEIVIPDEEPRDTFIAVEKEPAIVRSVVPEYPSLALKAGIEGKVFVKMWVDNKGKVREVRILRSNNDVFNDVSVEAAKQFVFTPAYMNNGPVSVWVAFPFVFRLKEAK